jgi:transcriptional regulator with XRE-family HTH domain
MSRINKRIPPLVSLRGIRMSQGLTGEALVAKIAERGVTISERGLYNAEAGNTGVSRPLLAAWAQSLGISPADVLREDDVRELVTEADGEAAA